MTASRRSSSALPHQLTTFVGRRQEATTLRAALEQSRLVTLTGSGGVGKTRLALHVAGSFRRAFRDGSHFVDLAKISDPTLVAHTIANALDLHGCSAESTEDALLDYLVDKQLLLILDNCEHVLLTAAVVASRILSTAGEIRVFATSREPLNVVGEQLFHVDPLLTPSHHDSTGPPLAVAEFDAVTLFVDRATAVAPTFALTPENQGSVGRICARLDGLPLAIELAAHRIRALSPEQILARLESRFELLTRGNRAAPERHQTLQAALDWSYDLCDDEEHLVWARCSVFAGDFDLEAAEFVCADVVASGRSVFSVISGLVDKSILIRIESTTHIRFGMLETVRQFGHDRLLEIGYPAKVLRQHRDYYAGLATRCDAESASARQIDWATRLPAERSNLLAALDYCIKTPGEAETGIRMAGALWYYWIACGRLQDARHWLPRILVVATEPTRERARVLWIAGWAEINQGLNVAGVELLGECHRLADAIEDGRARAHTVQMLGLAKTLHDDPPSSAIPLFECAIEEFRRYEQWSAPALMALNHRALAAALSGDVDTALRYSNECAEFCQRQDERWASSWGAWVLAVTMWVAGDVPATLREARAAYSSKRDLNDQLGVPSCIELVAWAEGSRGKTELAATLFGAADALWQRIESPLYGTKSLLCWSKENRERTGAALGRARYESRWHAGASMSLEDVSRLITQEEIDRSDTANRRSTRGSVAFVGPRLTKRERQVAALVAAGMSNREIAVELVIAQRTAETHVENILTKLGYSSRNKVCAWFHENGDSLC